MADRLNVECSWKIVDAADGSDFHSGSVSYSGIPYDFLVAMEQSVMATVASWGDAYVKAKKEKKGK